MNKRSVILLAVLSLLGIGWFNKNIGEIESENLTSVLLALWLLGGVWYLYWRNNRHNKEKEGTVSLDTETKGVLSTPEIPHTPPSEHAPPSSAVKLEHPAGTVQFSRGRWVKYVAVLNIVLFVVVIQYVIILPLATFVGLAFAGMNPLPMFLLSGIGTIVFIVITVISSYRAFSPKYRENFSVASKRLMFIPIPAAALASVFILPLVFPSVSSVLMPKSDRGPVIVVDNGSTKERIPIPADARAEAEKTGYYNANGIVYAITCLDCTFGADRYFSQVQNVDAVSFRTLGYYKFGKDKHRVFYAGKEIPKADPETFEVLKGGYAKDRNRAYHVSFGIREITEVDVVSFEALNRDFAKDQNHIYRESAKISNEPSNFRLIANSGFADMITYYEMNGEIYVYDGMDKEKLIPTTSTTTFAVLNGGFSRDEHGAFCFANTITLADLSTLQTVSRNYARDSVRVYYCDDHYGTSFRSVFTVIEGADPSSFHVPNADMAPYNGQDKNHKYVFGKMQ